MGVDPKTSARNIESQHSTVDVEKFKAGFGDRFMTISDLLDKSETGRDAGALADADELIRKLKNEMKRVPESEVEREEAMLVQQEARFEHLFGLLTSPEAPVDELLEAKAKPFNDRLRAIAEGIFELKERLQEGMPEYKGRKRLEKLEDRLSVFEEEWGDAQESELRGGEMPVAWDEVGILLASVRRDREGLRERLGLPEEVDDIEGRTSAAPEEQKVSVEKKTSFFESLGEATEELQARLSAFVTEHEADLGSVKAQKAIVPLVAAARELDVRWGKFAERFDQSRPYPVSVRELQAFREALCGRIVALNEQAGTARFTVREAKRNAKERIEGRMQSHLDGFRGELRALEAQLDVLASMHDVDGLQLLKEERHALHEQFKAYFEYAVPDEYIQSNKWVEFRDELLTTKKKIESALRSAERERELDQAADPADRGYRRLMTESGLWKTTDQGVRHSTIVDAVDGDLATPEMRKVVANVRQFKQLIAEYRAVLIAEGLIQEKQEATTPVVISPEEKTPEFKTVQLAHPMFESPKEQFETDASVAVAANEMPLVRVPEREVLEPEALNPIAKNEPVVIDTYLASDTAKAVVKKTVATQQPKPPKKARPASKVEHQSVPPEPVSADPEEEEPPMLADVKALRLIKRVKSFFTREEEKAPEQPAEKIEVTPRTEVAVRKAAGLISVVTRNIDMKSLVDVPRYLMQERAIEDDRARLHEAVQESIAQDAHVSPGERRRIANIQAADRLERAIAASTHLTDAQKKDLAHRLRSLRDLYVEHTDANEKRHNQEVAHAASEEMRGERQSPVLEVAGLRFLRGFGFGADKIIETTKRVAEKLGSFSFVEKLKQTFVDRFAARFAPKVSVSMALQTIGTIVGRPVQEFGMLEQAAPTLEKLRAENPNMDRLAVAAMLRLQSRIDEYLLGYGPLEEGARAGGVMPTLPEDYRLLDKETLKLAAVRSGDGLTQVLARQIQRNPEMFGYSGEGDVHVFSVKRAIEIAKADGIDDRWVRTPRAIGHVAVVPELRNGAVHAIFRDVATGHEIPAEALHEHGVSMSARAA